MPKHPFHSSSRRECKRFPGVLSHRQLPYAHQSFWIRRLELPVQKESLHRLLLKASAFCSHTGHIPGLHFPDALPVLHKSAVEYHDSSPSSNTFSQNAWKRIQHPPVPFLSTGQNKSPTHNHPGGRDRTWYPGYHTHILWIFRNIPAVSVRNGPGQNDNESICPHLPGE